MFKNKKKDNKEPGNIFKKSKISISRDLDHTYHTIKRIAKLYKYEKSKEKE